MINYKYYIGVVKFFLFIQGIILLCIQCSAGSPDTCLSDTEYIKRIIREEEVSWNKGDAEAYSLHFAQDGVFTNIFGQRFVGHEEFYKRHQQIFKGKLRGTIMQQHVVTIRFVTKDIAIVETFIQVSQISGEAKFNGIYIDEYGILKTRLLQVMQKEKRKGWKIIAYYNVDLKKGVEGSQKIHLYAPQKK